MRPEASVRSDLNAGKKPLGGVDTGQEPLGGVEHAGLKPLGGEI